MMDTSGPWDPGLLVTTTIEIIKLNCVAAKLSWKGHMVIIGSKYSSSSLPTWFSYKSFNIYLSRHKRYNLKFSAVLNLKICPYICWKIIPGNLDLSICVIFHSLLTGFYHEDEMILKQFLLSSVGQLINSEEKWPGTCHCVNNTSEKLIVGQCNRLIKFRLLRAAPFDKWLTLQPACWI